MTDTVRSHGGEIAGVVAEEGCCKVAVGRMGQHLGKREPSAETKGLSDPATRPTTEPESQDDVFGLNEPDVNQNQDGKSAGTTASSESPRAERANQPDPSGTGLRPHLARLFSRDAPGREDNTFKERPSESDELHTIHEAGAGSENAEDAD